VTTFGRGGGRQGKAAAKAVLAPSAVIHTPKERGRKAGKPSDTSHGPRRSPLASLKREQRLSERGRRRAGICGNSPLQAAQAGAISRMRTDGSTPVTGPNARASAGVNRPVPEPTSSPASGRRSGSTAAKALIHACNCCAVSARPRA
jgi:hypothetical protein